MNDDHLYRDSDYPRDARQVDAAVAELALDVFRVLRLGDQQTNVSVPQVMKPRPWQPSPSERRQEAPVKEISGILRGTVFGREDEIQLTNGTGLG